MISVSLNARRHPRLPSMYLPHEGGTNLLDRKNFPWLFFDVKRSLLVDIFAVIAGTFSRGAELIAGSKGLCCCYYWCRVLAVLLLLLLLLILMPGANTLPTEWYESSLSTGEELSMVGKFPIGTSVEFPNPHACPRCDLRQIPSQPMGEDSTDGDYGSAQRTSRTSLEMSTDADVAGEKTLVALGPDRNRAPDSRSSKRITGNQTRVGPVEIDESMEPIVLDAQPALWMHGSRYEENVTARTSSSNTTFHPSRQSLRLENGTSMPDEGMRTGVKRSLNSEGKSCGVDASCEKNNGASVTMATAHYRIPSDQRGQEEVSLKEWAAVAQKSGRVDAHTASQNSSYRNESPSRTSHDSYATGKPFQSPCVTSAHQILGAASEAQPKIHVDQETTLQRLVHARKEAREALLARNISATLTLCQSILRECPSDSTALLYQGTAIAQSGERDAAWKIMERILALSTGVQQNAAMVQDASGNGQGDLAQDSAESVVAVVPLDISLAAASNLASFARAHASGTLESNTETFFLFEALRSTAERETTVAAEVVAARGTRGQVESAMETVTSSSPDEEVVEARGFVGVLAMAARSLREKRQLTAALRLYQRAILLGGNRDQRTLHGLGGVYHLLRKVEQERLRNEELNPAKHRTQTPELGANKPWASKADSKRGCDWSIVQPRPGQVFPPGDDVPAEFDLAFLDPGIPSAGSLFETTGALPSFDGEGLGVVVCSYLEGFEGSNCLPSARMLGVPSGWQMLTAEAYQLPSLSPLGCFGDGENWEKHSKRTVRFCVGDTTTCDRSTENGSPADVLQSYGNAQEPLQSEHPRVKAKREPAVVVPATATADVELPFCFMTLALNAMPFIKHHQPVFQEVGEILASRAALATADSVALPENHFNRTKKAPATPRPEEFWEWQIVEGVAADRADHARAYSKQRIPDHYFDPVNGLSTDGTSEYLDEIVAQGGRELASKHREQIHVHRRCGEQARHGTSIEQGTPNGIGPDDQSAPSTTKWASLREPPPYEKGRKDRAEPLAGVDREAEGRKACLWRNKIQMVNAATFSLDQECLLVQIDADELWTSAQLVDLRDMFLRERGEGEDREVGPEKCAGCDAAPSRSAGSGGFTARGVDDSALDRSSEVTNGLIGRKEDGFADEVEDGAKARVQSEHRSTKKQEGDSQGPKTVKTRNCAYFDCHFFVGWDLVTVAEDGWGHSIEDEWLRAWVYRPLESVWLGHAPPELAKLHKTAGWRVLKGDECIRKDETRRKGLVFTHLAYVLEEQVRFKSHFYGYAETSMATPNSTRQSATNASIDTLAEPADAVAEWRTLQKAQTPVQLADHLTWLRLKGSLEEPRLLKTMADRPGVGDRSDEEEGGGVVRGETEQNIQMAGPSRTSSALSLERLQRMAREWQENSSAGVEGTPEHRLDEQRGAEDLPRDGIGLKGKTQRSDLTNDVYTRMRDTWVTGENARVADNEQGSEGCQSFHLVVDGAVFQIDAGKPKGIFRVWASVLPRMMDRLAAFEDTCLTLLIRSLAAPPRRIQDAFRGRPRDRFSIAHVPPYSVTFGFAADRLMLSWAMRSLKATAFVSTMYTQPLWATTPDVLRLLMIHDLLPEVSCLDMSTGEWLEKANAVALASRIVTVSQFSAKEFLRVYHPPSIPPNLAANRSGCSSGGDYDSVKNPPEASRPIWVAHNAVDTSIFHPTVDIMNAYVDGSNRNPTEAFRSAAGLKPGNPYVLIIGSRSGYKNARAAYRALGFAAGASSSTFALVIVGGGELTPEELEFLDEVHLWSHIGRGSASRATAAASASSSSPPTGWSKGRPVDDELLAAGYAGAEALLHMSIAEGFGLTVLEAFACGCPVVAVDIPPVREIAGLPNVATSAAGRKMSPSENNSAGFPAPRGRFPPIRYENPMPDSGFDGTPSLPASEQISPTGTPRIKHGTADSSPRETLRYGSVPSHLEGGLVLVENPGSATEIWRALRVVIAMDTRRRTVVSEALVQRAKVFDSWQPLADALIKAAVD